MNESTVPLPALSVSFYALAALLGSGVPLHRALKLLIDATPDLQLKQAWRHCVDRIAAGATLSEAMNERPEEFSATCRYMVRAGEVGGVLDVATQRLADHLEAEQALRERLALFSGLARLRGEAQEAWQTRMDEALAAVELARRQAEYCRGMGYLLGAGVPVLQALECAADEFEGTQRDQALTACQALRDAPDGDFPGLATVYEQVGLLPPLVCQLVAVGEQAGQLDLLLHRAADILEREIVATLNLVLTAGV